MTLADPNPPSDPQILADDRHGARTFSGRYPVWLCDVWGVVHDGLGAYPDACEALERHRAQGGTVVLITNAPRPSRVILPHLDRLGVSRRAYDAVVSSGDATVKLIAGRHGQKVFHLGPERDLALIEDTEAEFAGLDEAQVVLCTGLIDDDTEAPEDYTDLLRGMQARGLDMICANPDKVVRRGKTLLPCAGALAELYEAMGGTVLMAGKPHAPIYDAALETASQAAGRPIRRGEVLAIGDGIATDAEGAARNGFDMLFIVGGIHEAELDETGPAALVAVVRQAVPEVRLQGVMRTLHW